MKTKFPISEISALMQDSNRLGWVWQRVEQKQSVQWALVNEETNTPMQVYASGAILTAETRAIANLLPLLLESILVHRNISAEAIDRLEFVHLAFSAVADRLVEIEEFDLHRSLQGFNKSLRDAIELLRLTE